MIAASRDAIATFLVFASVSVMGQRRGPVRTVSS